MRTYLRNRVPGGTYFFTVNLAERKGNTLLIDRMDALRHAVRATRATRPFEIIAMVVLQNTCTPFGACLKAMTITRHAGAF